MKMIYISHPYTGNERTNDYKARLIAAKLAEEYPDIVFINPLAAMRHLRYTELPYETVLEQCIELLCCCEGIIMAGNWRDSKGCMKEYDFAKKVKFPIYDGIAEFKKAMENEWEENNAG